MESRWTAALLVAGLIGGAWLAGCGGRPATPAATPPAEADAPAAGSVPSPPAHPSQPPSPPPAPPPAPAAAGNPDGKAAVPAEARAEDTSKPTRVIGDGTAASCTSEAVVAAVAAGGVITFSCGPQPVTITMTATAKVRNANGPRIVLDGGGLVTLNGAGKRRILYLNTCDKAQGWTTSHCQNQDHPQLTVQNLTFVDGNSTGETAEGGGGGAIFVRGGRFKVVNSRFERNRCDPTGPDLGGAAIRVLSQFDGRPRARRQQHLHRRLVLQRRGTVEHRGVLGGGQKRPYPQTPQRERGQTGQARGAGRGERRGSPTPRAPGHRSGRRRPRAG